MINYSSLKKVLKQRGIEVYKPIFHACEYTRLPQILAQGLRSKAGYGDAFEKNAVCFSRSLDFYNYKNPSLKWVWDKTEVVLVFDERDLKTRLKSAPYNYHALNPHFNFGTSKNYHEFEERFFCTYKETVVPAKYIKAILTRYTYRNPDVPVIEFDTAFRPIPIDCIKAILNKDLYTYLQTVKDCDFDKTYYYAIKAGLEYVKPLIELGYRPRSLKGIGIEEFEFLEPYLDYTNPYEAITAGNIELVKKVVTPDQEGHDIAMMTNDKEIIEFFKPYGFNTDVKENVIAGNYNALYDIDITSYVSNYKGSDINMLKLFISQGADIPPDYYLQYTDEESVLLLLDYGVHHIGYNIRLTPAIVKKVSVFDKESIHRVLRRDDINTFKLIPNKSLYWDYAEIYNAFDCMMLIWNNQDLSKPFIVSIKEENKTFFKFCLDKVDKSIGIEPALRAYDTYFILELVKYVDIPEEYTGMVLGTGIEDKLISHERLFKLYVTQYYYHNTYLEKAREYYRPEYVSPEFTERFPEITNV